MNWRADYEREKSMTQMYKEISENANERADEAFADLANALDAVMDVFNVRDRYPDQTKKRYDPVNFLPREGPWVDQIIPGRNKFHADLKAAAASKQGAAALARILGTNHEENN